jgi:hypothetical protein
MAFEPAFMIRTEEYQRDKEQVRSIDDWVAFAQKWFDESDWPVKNAAQIESETLRKRELCSGRPGGRRWSPASFTYFDFSPEARYEYFLTLAEIGASFTFPERSSGPWKPEEGWSQECPYCEIATREIGDETCPNCHRRLLYSRCAD